jgi:hypothetical protein
MWQNGLSTDEFFIYNTPSGQGLVTEILPFCLVGDYHLPPEAGDSIQRIKGDNQNRGMKYELWAAKGFRYPGIDEPMKVLKVAVTLLMWLAFLLIKVDAEEIKRVCGKSKITTPIFQRIMLISIGALRRRRLSIPHT